MFSIETIAKRKIYVSVFLEQPAFVEGKTNKIFIKCFRDHSLMKFVSIEKSIGLEICVQKLENSYKQLTFRRVSHDLNWTLLS